MLNEKTLSSEPTRIEVIWGTRLLDEGFTSIPNLILRNYRRLQIEHGEWGLLCTLFSYKHDTRDPFPGHDTLAQHLCVSERQIRKWIESLVTKGMLRIGRRRHKSTKEFGPMVYNFAPLIDRALELVGSDSDPGKDDTAYDIVYQNEPPVPEVPVGAEPAEPQVRNPLEPEVPLKRLSLKDPKDTITTTIPAHAQEYTTSTKIHERLETHVHQPNIVPGQLSLLPDNREFNWSEKKSSTEPTPTPGEPNRTLELNKDVETRNPYEEIELRMQVHLQRHYIAKENDYRVIKQLLVSEVPLDWILDGIDRVFASRPDSAQRIRGFNYVAEILKDDWSKELVKRDETIQPIDFKTRTNFARKMSDTHSKINLSKQTLEPSVPVYDERYEAFYRLFPNS